MKLHRLLVSSTPKLHFSALRGTRGVAPQHTSSPSLLSLRISWVASQPSIRKYFGCSIPIEVGECGKVGNSMDKKGVIHPGKPVRSSSSVKPALEGNWKRAIILEKYPCAKAMWTIKLRADDVLEGFRIPGQFIQLKKGDSKPCYFAIASRPGCSTVELLVKEKATTQHIIQASEGSDLQISPVIGRGFPIKDEFYGHTYDEPPVRDVVIMCTGSGIGPIKSVIESQVLEHIANQNDSLSIGIYYCCAAPDEMAYVDHLKLWMKHGVSVTPVMSEVGKEQGWAGRTGFVQNVLLEDGINAPRDTGGLLVGQKDMVRHGRAILEDAGVCRHRILTNC